MRSAEPVAVYNRTLAKAEAIAARLLQFDEFAFDTPWEGMVYLFRTLEERGLGANILMSIDANWTFDESGRIWHEAEKEHSEAGKRTYAHMITHAIPMLLAEGFSLQQVVKYLVGNPRRLFEAAAV